MDRRRITRTRRGCLHAQNQQPAGGSVARFQVFTDTGRVFRLDTETGETVIYREGTMQGNQQYRYNYW